VNRYQSLLNFVPDAPQFELSPAPPHLLILSTTQNNGTAETHGVELSAQWQVVHRWKLAGSYTWLHMNVRPNGSTEQESPRHQIQIRSYLDLPGRAELNGALYYVSSIAPQSATGALLSMFRRMCDSISGWRGDPASRGWLGSGVRT